VLERYGPDAIERVLGCVRDAHAGEQRQHDADHERDGAAGERVQFELVADDRHLPERAVEDLVLLAGMGITNATQNALNRIWAVPFKHRPDFLHSRLRSLGMLAVLGTLSIVSAVVGGFVGSSSHPALTVVGGVLVAFVFNLALFMLAFKLLTAADLSWRELLPGVVTASVFWQLLQHLGGYYVDHELKRLTPLYGVFALVLGLLAWLYLGAQLTIFAAEVNVVRHRRLWPRSLFSPLIDADKRALSAAAEAQERVHEQNVEVSFDEPA
jgi:membrane protein